MGFWRGPREFIRAFLRPRGADKVLQILHGLAMIDGELDRGELAFIRSFAKRWGFDLHDVLRTPNQSHPVEAQSVTSLRDAMVGYLATDPPIDQVHHLRDLLTSLVTIDGKICQREELIMGELGRMIDAFTDDSVDTSVDTSVDNPADIPADISANTRAGTDGSSGFVVVITPKNGAQKASLIQDMPSLEQEQRRGATVFNAGTYHSLAYAKLVCSWYDEAGYSSSVVRG